MRGLQHSRDMESNCRAEIQATVLNRLARYPVPVGLWG
jgi:hypothetical protein